MGFPAKASDVKAPFGDGVAATNVLFFTCDSTSRCNALPNSLQGKFVRVVNTAANGAFYFFSNNASASCDETLAASDAGTANASLGEYLPPGATAHLRLPYWNPDQVRYFVRASVSSAPLMIIEASG
jgi:hypothetical protein